MNKEQRQEAIFGAFDGVVSVIGFIFGLLLHHSTMASIAIGGLGGAIASGVSMGAGEFEKADTPLKRRLPLSAVMLVSTLIGSLVPVWPFFIFGRSVAMMYSAIGCLVVATWIGYEKRDGIKGYAVAYATLLASAGLTLAVIAAIPQSVG